MLCNCNFFSTFALVGVSLAERFFILLNNQIFISRVVFLQGTQNQAVRPVNFSRIQGCQINAGSQF